MKITSEHLEAARLMGACKSRLQAYQPGDDLSRVTVDDLIWIESRDKKLARKIADSSTHNTPAGVLWVEESAIFRANFLSRDSIQIRSSTVTRERSSPG